LPRHLRTASGLRAMSSFGKPGSMAWARGGGQLSPASDPLPEFVPPTKGPPGQDVLIVWDFQNVRVPDELEPEQCLRWASRCTRPRHLAGADSAPSKQRQAAQAARE
jgi:hypothetical protein